MLNDAVVKLQILTVGQRGDVFLRSFSLAQSDENRNTMKE